MKYNHQCTNVPWKLFGFLILFSLHFINVDAVRVQQSAKKIKGELCFIFKNIKNKFMIQSILNKNF